MLSLYIVESLLKFDISFKISFRIFYGLVAK